MPIRLLLSMLGTVLLAPSAGANDLEKLARAVDAVVQASRSSEGVEGSWLFERIDPEQEDLLRSTYGPDAVRAVGDLRVETVGTLETRIPPEGEILADILRAEPGLARLGSLGLAGLLRRAHQHYSGHGKALPEAVQVMLSISFPKEILERVRVIDTDAEGSLPAILNELQTNYGDAIGGESAVTIDDLIAFSEIPKLSEVDFWAHEIQHVVQYHELGGIDAFAAAYTRDYQKLERDANAASKKAVIDAQNVLAVIRALNSQRLE